MPQLWMLQQSRVGKWRLFAVKIVAVLGQRLMESISQNSTLQKPWDMEEDRGINGISSLGIPTSLCERGNLSVGRLRKCRYPFA